MAKALGRELARPCGRGQWSPAPRSLGHSAPSSRPPPNGEPGPSCRRHSVV